MNAPKIFSRRRETARAVTAGVNVVLGAMLLIAGGCHSRHGSRLGSAPAPAMTGGVATPGEAAVPPLGSGAAVIVSQPPPTATEAQMAYIRPEQPSEQHVWIDGHWTCRDGLYAWINAHWEIPPDAGAKWIPPRWEPRRDGNFVFYEAHWN